MSGYENLYDVIIVGGGPAGLTAAIYAARAKERVLVIEKIGFGGQIALTENVMNYPGILSITGSELADLMKKQAEDFGAELKIADISRMDLDGTIKKIHTDQGVYSALSVILAVGAIPRDAGFEGEAYFRGNGVGICATCDAPYYEGCDLYVVGGGLAAVEESIYLAKYARSIKLIVREMDFTCAKTVSDKLKLYPQIEVLFHTEIVKVDGLVSMETVTLRDNLTKKEWTETKKDRPIGIFVFVGYEPNTAWLPDCLEKDAEGYLLTDENNRTNIPGVCAAGDVRRKSLRQVVTATSDGAIAAVALEPVVKAAHEKRNIPELAQVCSYSILPQDVEKALLRVWLDDSALSKEMVSFLEEQKFLQDVVDIEIHKEGRSDILLPSIEICKKDGSSSGIHFHAVPKGLEWNSFQIALFNVMGPGQKMTEENYAKCRTIDKPVNLKVLMSLSCGNCPASVMSACQIAASNKYVTTEIIDLNHYRKIRYKYNVSSVPMLIINDKTTVRGKMQVDQMIDKIINNI